MLTLGPPCFSGWVLEWGMAECRSRRDVEPRTEALGQLAVLELVREALRVGATVGDAKLWAAELFPWVHCTRNISPVTPANVWMKEEHGYRKIIAV